MAATPNPMRRETTGSRSDTQEPPTGPSMQSESSNTDGRIIPITQVARTATADDYQGGLSAFHSAAAGYGGPTVGWTPTLVSPEHSANRVVLITTQTRNPVLSEMVLVLRQLSTPMWFFVTATLHGVPVNPAGEDGDDPQAVYKLSEELVEIYNVNVPFTKLQKAESRSSRRKLLHKVMGPNRDCGANPHTVSPVIYTKYSKHSEELPNGDYRFWFDSRVLYLHGIRSSRVFGKYLGGTRVTEGVLIKDHEEVWDIPRPNVGGGHRPIVERHVQISFQVCDAKTAMKIYRKIAPIVNTNTMLTNMVGTMRLEGRCTKDFAVCCLARIWMEIVGYHKVAAAWVFAQGMMVSGVVTNTTTVREFHGKNYGHYNNSRGASILATVIGYALSNSKGNTDSATYLAVTGAL